MQKSRWFLAGIVVLLGMIAVSAWITYPWRTLNPDFMFRFFALSERYQLTREEKESAISIVREAITNYRQPETPADPPLDAPERFTVRDPREIWVTLYLPRIPGTSAMATEANLYRSLRQATREALLAAKDRESWLRRQEEIAIQIDVMQDRAPLRSKQDWYFFFAVEPGVDGLILSRGEKTHYQLPSDAVTRGYLTPRVRGRAKSVRKLLGWAARDMKTRRKAWLESDMVLAKFRTISFGEPVPGEGLEDFFRGNVLLTHDELNADRIYKAIHDGAQWLLDNAKADGKFNYAYYPNRDHYPKSYNAVRHAGTVYGLLELHRYFQDPKFLRAARRAMPYLYDHIKRPGREKEFLAIPDGNAWPTGAAALGLLAFVNMPPEMRTPRYPEIEQGLGHFLLRMIDDRGKVFQGYLAAKGSDRVRKEPLYYPGESMLALARFYEQTGEDKWLEGAKHIAEQQIKAYVTSRRADHWVIQGLYQLYRHTGDDSFGEWALSMADSYIDTQCPPNTPPFPDYFGAYRRVNETPRTTRAGSRSEAMTAAVKTAWEMGVDPRAYEDSLLFAAKHQIEQQFRPESAFYLLQPKRAIGGFRAGLVDNQLRIDFNQHSSVGMLGALEVAVKREGREPWWTVEPLVAPDVIGGPTLDAAPSPTGAPSPVPGKSGSE